MPRSKHVELLLVKAAEDEAIIDIAMQHPSAPAAAIGFHAQQAVEKLLKAVLRARDVGYPLTHNIGFLLELLQEAEVAVPPAFSEAAGLTPFAVEFRYDALPPEGSADLDVIRARELVREIRAWAEAQMRTAAQANGSGGPSSG